MLIGIALVLFFDLNLAIFDYAFPKRIIKLFAIIITSIAISSSTIVFQSITTNRILTPSVFGLDSLYLLIQALVIFVLSPVSIIIQNPYINFIVNFVLMAAFGLVLFNIMFAKFDGLFQLLLTGIIFSTLFQSIVSVIMMLMDPASFSFYQSFMFASFNLVNDTILLLTAVLITLVFIYLLNENRTLDIISSGKDNSINLGIDYNKKVYVYLICVFILTAISTALVGPITFLGFLVVNLTKTYLNTYKHKYLLPAASMISVAVLAFGHILTEELFGFGVPISILINLIGGLYFIRMLLKENLA
jgi:iron complex transport system permease protein